MIILGIDYGAKKIGLAKADSQARLAVPLVTLENNGPADLVQKLQTWCQSERIEKIVVGVPISLQPAKRESFLRHQDLQNKQMQAVLGFIDWLKENFSLPIEMEDERLSTKMANTLQKDLVKKNGDDAIAAMLILQTYLDRPPH